MDRQTLSERRVTGASDALQTRNEIDFAICRSIEWEPSQLCGRDMDAFVDGEEV